MGQWSACQGFGASAHKWSCLPSSPCLTRMNSLLPTHHILVLQPSWPPPLHSHSSFTFLSPFLAPLLLSAVNFGVYQDFSSIQIHFQVNAFCPMILNTTYFMITLKLICPAWTSSLNCRSRYLTFNLLSVIECLTGGLSLISKMNS